MKIQIKAAGLVSSAALVVALLVSLGAASDPTPPEPVDPTVTPESTNEVAVLKEIPAALPPNLALSPGIEEIVKLAQGGVSDTVLLAYIDRMDKRFDLKADEILYLNDLGLSQDVIAAMLTHDGGDATLAQKVLEQDRSGTTSPTAPQVAATTTPPAAPPTQAPLIVTSNYTPNPAPQYQNFGAEQQQPPAIVQQPAVVQQPVVVQQPQVVVAPPTVYDSPEASYSYFYSSLSPYGSWVLMDGYGWCWQPTVAVVNTGWRPYCHGGRWLYSDCGWYWQSDYSWGWAPFHYGRWFCPPGRSWVWAPDYTWGPSWVTWRSHEDYCGWAPLPPHAIYHEGIGFTYYGSRVGVGFGFGLGFDYFTFVPTRHFSDRRLISHVIATREAAGIYRHSTVVNNYAHGNGNTFINIGISREHIVNVTHHDIPRIAVRDVDRGHGGGGRPDRIVHEGREPVILRPKPPTVEAAHQFDVRKNQEMERVAVASSSRGQVIPGRSPSAGSSGFAANNPPARQFLSPRAAQNIEGTSPSRPADNARDKVATRAVVPPLGKPAPLKPEPPSIIPPAVRTRARQETTVAPSPTFPPYNYNSSSSSIANRPAGTPQAPGRVTPAQQQTPAPQNHAINPVPSTPRAEQPYSRPITQPQLGSQIPQQRVGPQTPATQPAVRQPEPNRNVIVPGSRLAENGVPGYNSGNSGIVTPRPAPTVPSTPIPAQRPAPSIPSTPVPVQRQEPIARPTPAPSYHIPAPSYQPRPTPSAPPSVPNNIVPAQRVSPAPSAPAPSAPAHAPQNVQRAPSSQPQQGNNRRNENPR